MVENVHTPMWKSHLKHSMAEVQSIQQFWLQLDIVSQTKKKEKIKNADARVWGDVCGDQKPESLFFAWRD